MFLRIMNQEEKKKFLEFAYKVANIDGEYAEEEQEIIDSYKNELDLDTIGDTGSIEELIDFFASKTESLKKVILFETVGLVNADDKIEKEESDVLSLMNDKFGFNAEISNKINATAKKLQEVYDEVYNVLFD